MPDRTELKHLSHDQKDDLILKLQSQVVELQSALETLQARLNLNSTNSSKPSSSDGLKKHPKKKPKSLREASGRKPGGQAGHVGKTLQQVEHADTTIRYEVPEKCSACQSTLPEAKVGEIRQVFDLPITKFEVTAHHAMQATCQCGKVHANLINRLREYADDVWRFMEQPDVPFTNNLAEQAVRMPKVKQKISGVFRATRGAYRFCTIRSYLATMQKQGADIFDCLVKTFSGNVPQPNLA